jgi:beta-galactosidase/beta-glucuronidase
MDFEFSTDGFLPYDSFDYIYKDRKLPEFGNVESPYVRTLSSWKFFVAQGEGQVPFGFESSSFDDSDWDIINVPSTWQTEGYGMPQNLLYNYPGELEKISKRGEESISDKYIIKSTNEDQDEIGLYRTTVVFTPQDIDRALYFEASGICGSFDLYLNGQLMTESHSVMTRKRILLSDSARPGTNQIAIAVYRWDREKYGHVIKELMNFGFLRPCKARYDRC